MTEGHTYSSWWGGRSEHHGAGWRATGVVAIRCQPTLDPPLRPIAASTPGAVVAPWLTTSVAATGHPTHPTSPGPRPCGWSLPPTTTTDAESKQPSPTTSTPTTTQPGGTAKRPAAPVTAPATAPPPPSPRRPTITRPEPGAHRYSCAPSRPHPGMTSRRVLPRGATRGHATGWQLPGCASVDRARRPPNQQPLGEAAGSEVIKRQ